MTRSRPLVSTIIPVYNVESYLRETLDSIIHQDIGFMDNVEIVLVNDGSPDDSDKICREYRDKYPDNIRYIEQKNAGVSVARNNGLEVASGEYVHFLDSDDLISKNAYSAALKLISSHKDKIDFVALNIEFFEAQLGGHPLNYKFTSDRIVDINKEPDAIILHMATCLMRRSAIKHRFDSSIKISEDMKFLSELLGKKKRYGVVASAYYYYRKRKTDNSAIDRAQEDPSYYRVTPRKVYEQILLDWTESGRIHPYAQWVVMYDIQWRLRQKSQNVLDKKEQDDYKESIWRLLKSIDDSIIVAQRHMAVAYKEYALKMKHGDNIAKRLQKDWPNLYKSFQPKVQVEFIDYDTRSCSLKIECSFLEGSDAIPVDVEIDGESYPRHTLDVIYRKNLFLGEVVYSGQSFMINVPLEVGARSIVFYREGSRAPLQVITKRQSRLPNVKSAYRAFPGILVSHEGSRLVLRTRSVLRHIFYEIRWDIRLFLSLRLQLAAKKMWDILQATLKSHIGGKEIIYPVLLPIVSAARNCLTIGYRLLYYLSKPFIKKSIWLISDRMLAAGDNGEALYDYIREQNNPSVKAYFVISKKSPDYVQLKKRGFCVLNGDSLRYRLLFLHASKVISSHADDYVINPFTHRVDFLNDLFRFDFVFLQHGIIVNDLSSWLNRYNKDIRLFITSTQREYDSILEYPYCYTEKNVLLSGLPRYDKLASDPQSKLILAPTWRHDLVGDTPVVKGQRAYNSDFRNSEYFKFYNKLMNDPKLHRALKTHNMTAEFYLHPSFEAQVVDFEQNDLFKVKDFPYDYRTAFREGSLLVSDYSSVIFDFVYLEKPIIYIQHDYDAFYKNHMHDKGYMQYERDGFGPIAKTYEQSIARIIDMLDSGCVMQDIYKKRAEKFFAWHDKDNSRRVYDAILKLDD